MRSSHKSQTSSTRQLSSLPSPNSEFHVEEVNVCNPIVILRDARTVSTQTNSLNVKNSNPRIHLHERFKQAAANRRIEIVASRMSFKPSHAVEALSSQEKANVSTRCQIATPPPSSSSSLSLSSVECNIRDTTRNLYRKHLSLSDSSQRDPTPVHITNEASVLHCLSNDELEVLPNNVSTGAGDEHSTKQLQCGKKKCSAKVMKVISPSSVISWSLDAPSKCDTHSPSNQESSSNTKKPLRQQPSTQPREEKKTNKTLKNPRYKFKRTMPFQRAIIPSNDVLNVELFEQMPDIVVRTKQFQGPVPCHVIKREMKMSTTSRFSSDDRGKGSFLRLPSFGAPGVIVMPKRIQRESLHA